MSAAVSILTGKMAKVSYAGEVVLVPADGWEAAADALIEKHGFGHGLPQVELVDAVAPTEPPPAAVVPETAPALPVNSTWTEQVVDATATVRIEKQHAALRAAGVAVDASQQLYSTGTRMADIGYATQEKRKAAHDKAMTLAEAAASLSARVQGEGREDVEISAREFGNAIHVNGVISVRGRKLTENAIRGLSGRLGSPMLSYVLGLRERIILELQKSEGERDMSAVASDKAKLAEVLRHECLRNGDRPLVLRTRRDPGDIFAVVSPSFGIADAPEVLEQLAAKLPADARATWSYDADSTAWELRANVWTATPVAEQAVGEPFEGYASFQARDNGTRRIQGGGGISLIRCLNATTYTAHAESGSRVHRGEVMVDIEKMVASAVKSIDILCGAWGQRREERVYAPSGVPIEVAIPGFWRALLTDRRSELAGVLPGRKEANVAALTKAFVAERRNEENFVRADFAQGWTRMIQDLPTTVRRDAEQAVGKWMVEARRPMECDFIEE